MKNKMIRHENTKTKINKKVLSDEIKIRNWGMKIKLMIKLKGMNKRKLEVFMT